MKPNTLFVNSVLYFVVSFTSVNSERNIIHTGITSYLENNEPDGRTDVVTVTLYQGMKPGSLLNFVFRADDNKDITINDDNNNVLFKMSIWFHNNTIHIDGPIEKYNFPNPVTRCAKTNGMIVYTSGGYKVFLNGRNVGLFKHGNDKAIKTIIFAFDRLYKIYYLTTETVVKV